jgi:hypothetical protein
MQIKIELLSKITFSLQLLLAQLVIPQLGPLMQLR